MNEVTQIPAPKAIQHLIQSNNQLLRDYQDELTAQVVSANKEMMTLLGLDPNDGWALNADTMMYVKNASSENAPTK